jgi:adenylate cyclase
MGLIFMAPFMFDFGVMIYRIIAITIFGTTFDLEWAFDAYVRHDEAYYELYLKVFAAALTGLILVARNDLVQRQAIETQRKLTSAYQRFVPEEILSTLGKTSILDLNLGDQVEQNMSILFSDIREFTATSEKLSPEQNFKFINDYLEIMVPIVQKNNGFVDKFIGDAVMAIFPENADNAINCALEMQSAIPKVNAKISEYLDKELEIGVGINTGMVRLGTLGALERMEGSVISDAVNLAARVEQLTKQYPENVIVTEFTKMAASNYNFNELDVVKVKGKSHSVKIYGVSS